MKKTIILTTSLAGLLACSAFATGTAVVAWDNQSLTSVAPGGSFTIDFHITSGTNPALTTIGGWDLFLESLSPNVNNNFQISSRMVLPNGSTFTNSGTPTYPDKFLTSYGASDGSATNGFDQGVSYTSGNPMVGADVVQLTITVLGTAPLGMYTFENTPSSGFTRTNGPGGPDSPFTLVFDPGFQNQYDVNQAQFSINVVPEPATLSLLGLGGLGTLGMTLLRARRTA